MTRLLFPVDGSSWNILVNASYTQMWLKEDEVAPKNVPEDDEEKGILSSYSIIERQSGSKNLYEPFSINVGLSYSCSSNTYNNYSVSFNGSEVTNGSTVIFRKIQVLHVVLVIEIT